MAADAGASLRRGIAVLFALEGDAADGRSGLGVTQIAQLIGRDKSQVSRTLKILAEYGLVERDPDTRAYRLSARLYALAGRAGDQQLLDQARPYLRATVERLGERAHLSVLQGAEVLTLLSESPPHAVQAAGWVGRTVPVHCTAAAERSSSTTTVSPLNRCSPGSSSARGVRTRPATWTSSTGR